MKEIKNYIKSVVAEMRSDVERINSYASMPAQAGAFMPIKNSISLSWKV